MKKRQKEVKNLTPRQQRFVELYLGCLNAAQAATEAGFSENTANSTATLWVRKNKEECPSKHQHIWEAVQQGLVEKHSETAITTTRFLKELAFLALLDPKDAFDPGTLRLRSLDEIPEEIRRCIQSVSPVKGGGFKVSFYDKTKALSMVGQYLGAFIQKHELTGPNGGPIKTEGSGVDLSRLSTDDLIQLRQILTKSRPDPATSEPSGN
jgi:phage terminase small subunit